MSRFDSPPVIIDVDQSVLKLAEDEIRLNFSRQQEELRYGCPWPVFRRFEESLSLPPQPGCLFLGSGDFHHLSLAPLKKLAAAEGPLEVVVCDNHPDNMRYPFGVHCGSWVRWAAGLSGVSHVHVLGITSADVAWAHAWENNWRPLMRGRLTYWVLGRKIGWLKLLGGNRRGGSFETADELLEAFARQTDKTKRVYLSIDKDVFGPETITTNWDQGRWEKKHLQKIVQILGGRLAGADVTGEVSAYEYQGFFKKILTRLDGLEQPKPAKLAHWQQEQQKFNLEILSLLKAAGG